MTAFPKPQKRPPKKRKPLNRSWMRRKPPRRLARQTEAETRYVHDLHSLPCVGLEHFSYTHHVCEGRIEQSHQRDHTGLGLKAPPMRSIPMCQALHRAWEGRYGVFTGWDNPRRQEWMKERVAETWLRMGIAEAVPGWVGKK